MSGFSTRPATNPGGISKRDQTEILRRKLKAGNYDPVEELIKLAKATDATTDTKLSVAKTLVEFVYPRLKSVDLDAKHEHGFRIELVQFTQPAMRRVKGEKEETPQLPEGEQKVTFEVPPTPVTIPVLVDDEDENEP